MKKLIVLFLALLLISSCKSTVSDPEIEQEKGNSSSSQQRYYPSFKVICNQHNRGALVGVEIYRDGESFVKGGTIPTGWYGSKSISFTRFNSVKIKISHINDRNNVFYQSTPFYPDESDLFVTNKDDVGKKGGIIRIDRCSH